jgi:hypothetical protein
VTLEVGGDAVVIEQRIVNVEEEDEVRHTVVLQWELYKEQARSVAATSKGAIG